MPRYLVIALNGPTGGKDDEAEYNRWFDEIHVPDLKKVDGALSTRRFKVETKHRIDQPYVCVTEVEAENADAVMKELAKKASNLTDKLDNAAGAFLICREITKVA
jgi:hypothetical protein